MMARSSAFGIRSDAEKNNEADPIWQVRWREAEYEALEAKAAKAWEEQVRANENNDGQGNGASGDGGNSEQADSRSARPRPDIITRIMN